MDAAKAATTTQKPHLSCLLPKQGQARGAARAGSIPSSTTTTLPRAQREPKGHCKCSLCSPGTACRSPECQGESPKAVFCFMARICWQPPVSLALQVGIPARTLPVSITLHPHCCPEAPVPGPATHSCCPQVSQHLCCLHGQRLALGLCHTFEPCSRISSPGLGFSPPNALRDKHTAAASTSSSISGFAE